MLDSFCETSPDFWGPWEVSLTPCHLTYLESILISVIKTCRLREPLNLANIYVKTALLTAVTDETQEGSRGFKWRQSEPSHFEKAICQTRSYKGQCCSRLLLDISYVNSVTLFQGGFNTEDFVYG